MDAQDCTLHRPDTLSRLSQDITSRVHTLRDLKCATIIVVSIIKVDKINDNDDVAELSE